MARFYGRNVWDPKLIVYQIVAVQCFHYESMGLLLLLFRSMFGTTASVDAIFAGSATHRHTGDGLAMMTVTLLGAAVTAVVMCLVVERAKKVLDFACTLQLLHFTVCVLYEDVPSSWEWWVANSLSLVGMVLLGEHLCARRELREIPMLEFMTGRGNSGSPGEGRPGGGDEEAP